jgi:FG-GAP repeat protein
MRSSRTTLAVIVGLMLAVGVVFSTPSMAASTQVKLTASDGTAGDHFGVGVAISGDTMLAGAPKESNGAIPAAGAGYVYSRSGSTWTQQAKLLASDAAPGAMLGFSAALSGDTAVLGAFYDTVGTKVAAGSAYVFTRSRGVWTQQARLTASDGAATDNFGFSVAVDGDTVVVGATGGDANIRAGAAYVFTRTGGSWTQQAKLTASDAADGYFGVSVAVSRDTALVGSVNNDVGGNEDQGAVYEFTRAGGVWTRHQKLTADDGAAGDSFGHWVAVSGDTAVVGAYFDDVDGRDDQSKDDQGSAYVFARSTGTWTQQAHLKASDGAAGDLFGRSVALSGNAVIVGAEKDDSIGSAYRFARVKGIWSEQEKLTAADRDADAFTADTFGVSVGVSGDTAVVGAFSSTVGLNLQQGAAYVFDHGMEE